MGEGGAEREREISYWCFLLSSTEVVKCTALT